MTYKRFDKVVSFADKLLEVSFRVGTEADCLKNQLNDACVGVDQLVSLPHFLKVCLEL